MTAPGEGDAPHEPSPEPAAPSPAAPDGHPPQRLHPGAARRRAVRRRHHPQEEAARFAGIRVRWIKPILFVISGTVAAFAGAVFTLRYGSARADNGIGLELAVIAAVLLGGVDFDGGRGPSAGCWRECCSSACSATCSCSTT